MFLIIIYQHVKVSTDRSMEPRVRVIIRIGFILLLRYFKTLEEILI